MRFEDAINALGLEPDYDEAALKTAYRSMSKKYHPDTHKEAGEEMMKVINAAYDFLTKYRGPRSARKGSAPAADYPEKLYEAIKFALSLSGVHLEICGNWLWLTGNTKEHKTALKEKHFLWAPKKCAWFFRPEEYKSSGRGEFSMDDIRARYGSASVAEKRNKEKEEQRKAIAG